MFDVVYILKKDARPDELRYSLRSVDKNFPHRAVWFYCGKPEGLTPDEYVPHIQSGYLKWEKARSSVLEICKNENITRRFWLFNDDFYIMRPYYGDGTPFHCGTLHDHIARVEARHGHRITAYTQQLRNTEAILQRAGLGTIDYAGHLPLLIEREKMLEALETFPACPMFRSLYGNYANIGGVYHEDVKINDPKTKPDPTADYLSSSDVSFRGEVGRFLAKRFPERSRFEVK